MGKKKRRFKLIHVITCAIIIYTIITVWNQRSLMIDLQSKKKEEKLVNSQLEKEIKDLEKEIQNSQTLEFVEKVARDELGMVKPREIIVIDKNKTSNPFLKTIKKEN